MCVNWIFAKCSADNHVTGFSVFITISLIGLAITELCLWYFTEIAGVYYIFSKVIAGLVSFLVLFAVRKRLLFS